MRPPLLIPLLILFVLPLVILSGPEPYGLFLGSLYSLIAFGVLYLVAREDPLPMLAAKERQIAELEEELSTFRKPQVASPEEAEEVSSQYDAASLLHKCLEIAAMTPGRHSGFLDLRRLSERLQEETSAVIALYSSREERLLFVNNLVRAYFGLPPDRFVREFSERIQGGRMQWEDALASVEVGKDVSLRIVLKSHVGEATLVQSLLGVIPTGPFKGLVMAIIYR